MPKIACNLYDVRVKDGCRGSPEADYRAHSYRCPRRGRALFGTAGDEALAGRRHMGLAWSTRERRGIRGRSDRLVGRVVETVDLDATVVAEDNAFKSRRKESYP